MKKFLSNLWKKLFGKTEKLAPTIELTEKVATESVTIENNTEETTSVCKCNCGNKDCKCSADCKCVDCNCKCSDNCKCKKPKKTKKAPIKTQSKTKKK
jgi:hypothetical protein